jgi:hypothetical protein
MFQKRKGKVEMHTTQLDKLVASKVPGMYVFRVPGVTVIGKSDVRGWARESCLATVSRFAICASFCSYQGIASAMPAQRHFQSPLRG